MRPVFLLHMYILFITPAPIPAPSLKSWRQAENDEKGGVGGEGDTDREADKYFLKMLLCLLLECCLEYLYLRVILFHHQ